MIKLSVKGKNPYVVASDFVYNYFGWYVDAIVDLETENAGRSNSLILAESPNGCYYWTSDWYEGGDELIIHGIQAIHSVDIPPIGDKSSQK